MNFCTAIDINARTKALACLYLQHYHHHHHHHLDLHGINLFPTHLTLKQLFKASGPISWVICDNHCQAGNMTGLECPSTKLIVSTEISGEGVWDANCPFVTLIIVFMVTICQMRTPCSCTVTGIKAIIPIISHIVILAQKTSALQKDIHISVMLLILTLRAPYSTDGSEKKRIFLLKPVVQSVLTIHPKDSKTFWMLRVAFQRFGMITSTLCNRHYNKTNKHYQKDKIVPQGGSPDDVEEYPEGFGFVNFKLVPKDFDILIEHGGLGAENDMMWDESVIEAAKQLKAQHYLRVTGMTKLARDNVAKKRVSGLPHHDDSGHAGHSAINYAREGGRPSLVITTNPRSVETSIRTESSDSADGAVIVLATINNGSLGSVAFPRSLSQTGDGDIDLERLQGTYHHDPASNHGAENQSSRLKADFTLCSPRSLIRGPALMDRMAKQPPSFNSHADCVYEFRDFGFITWQYRRPDSNASSLDPDHHFYILHPGHYATIHGSPSTTIAQQKQHKISSGAIIGIAIAAAVASLLIAGGLLFWIRYRRRRALSPSQEYRRQIHNLTPFMTPATTIPALTKRLRPEKNSETLTRPYGEGSRDNLNPRPPVASREVVRHEDSGWRPPASANRVVEMPPSYDDSTRALNQVARAEPTAPVEV
ncbi:hypothetical protein L218DRAFT_948669 [Marasmius fiardii PR-910]|nr:hypothetical protein L218DRAFT_948669 [Marasmius fiardii PR-910]